MRLNLDIDNELLRKAQELSGERDATALVSEALNALIERKTARRLVRLGGSDAGLETIRRRRP
jgi:hypothetical protein